MAITDGNSPASDPQALSARVEKALDRVRPALYADGGDARVVEIRPGGVVVLELQGACGGCAMSQMTLRQGIERVIRMEVPEVTAVEALRSEF